MTTALVLIDLQNDDFQGGAMAQVGVNEASSNAAALMHASYMSARSSRAARVPSTHAALAE